MAYDALNSGGQGTREYLAILQLAAQETEIGVDAALRTLIYKGERITADAVRQVVASGQKVAPATEVRIAAVDLGHYDALLVGVN
jgi:hypothetical protein